MLTLECANKTLCQNYTVIYRRLHRYGTALTEEQLGQHEILRAPHFCGRALRMTSFFVQGGFAPCTPIRDCEHRCLTIIVQFDILFSHIQVCQQSVHRIKASVLFLCHPVRILGTLVSSRIICTLGCAIYPLTRMRYICFANEIYLRRDMFPLRET